MDLLKLVPNLVKGVIKSCGQFLYSRNLTREQKIKLHPRHQHPKLSVLINEFFNVVPVIFSGC